MWSINNLYYGGGVKQLEQATFGQEVNVSQFTVYADNGI